MSKQIENAIREKRTNQAVKNNLMGPSGKFGIILRAFGVSVIRQGSAYSEVTYLEDPFGDDAYTEYGSTASGQDGPIVYREGIALAEDVEEYYEGLVFDGLSRGLHFEIMYWEGLNELKVSYKGYVVYREVEGILDGYAPFDDWESITERLYRSAKEYLKKNKKQEQEAITRLIDAKKQSFWQKLRMKWGI